MSRNKSSYDLSSKPDGYFAQKRSEMLKYIPQKAKTILDVGCGYGLFSQLLKEKFNAEVWGIELDKTAAVEARKKIDEAIEGDVNKAIDKLPDKKFDCVVFNDILEHLANPFEILTKIKDKASERGVIVCSIPNVRYIRNLKKLLIDKQWEYEDEGVLDKTHLRFFTLKSVVKMFEDLGYEIIRIEGINPTKSWKFRLINLLFLGNLSDARYLQFACVAKPKTDKQ